MTVALEEFAEWRDSVETRLGKLETVSEKHAERISHDERLRGAMDRDLGGLHAEFRAQRSLLQALPLTQNEHTRTLGEHTRTLSEHTRTLSEHTRTLSEHSAALRELRTGQAELRQELTEARVGVRTIIGLLESAGGGDR